MASPDAQTMQCMEVWGGNQPFSGGVIMAGLDAWIHSVPYAESEGGGDIHYVSSCATGRITRLLVADVSGHGAAVADTAASLRKLMRRYVNFIDQTRFVETMNQQFSALSETHLFATAIVTTFFAPTRHLSLSNAGHPPPLLYSRATRRWELLENRRPASQALSNMPLGVIDITQYDQIEIRLGVGDLVMCYTDSLIESHDEKGELIGAEGLLEILQHLDPADPSALIQKLLETIRSKAADNLTGDDVTILVFRPNGLGTRAPLADWIRAPFRVATGVVKSAFQNGSPAPWPEFSLANLGGAVFGPLSRLWRGRNDRTA